jgi:ferredoxin
LVLDLTGSPLIGSELPPPGYKHAGRDEGAIDSALVELRDLVGDFEKPRYFNYDPDICAHGMKGATACHRCIDACPADAISSLVERVQVEPALCQGGGACATACPTGAIGYSYPSVEDLLERVRRLLIAYREAGGETPVLLVHDTLDGAERVGRLLSDPQVATGHLVPLAVEEVASLGLEAWFTVLAYGAAAVRLVDGPRIPASSRGELTEQLGFARAILAGLGYPRDALAWLADLDARAAPIMPAIAPWQQAAVGGKRQLFFAALDRLYGESDRARPLVELPAGAPFGTATVDEKACTLCMACVTVCPGKALLDGQDVPQLKFLEANCVQCGLCTRSCPEDAIWISPRLLLDAGRRGKPRLLREDSPFHCVSCGSAFATASVIGRMQQRLAGHSMFKGERDRYRLQMCGDCRVADMMREQEQLTGSGD